MARDGSGNYSRVEGPYVNGTVADADEVNAEFDDVATALSQSWNTAGTKAPSADQPMGGFILTGLGAGASNGDSVRYEQVIGVFQPLDADLTAFAALGYTSGSYLIKKTAANTYALIAVTAAGEALLDDAAASDQRTTLGLGIGVDVQAYDADTAKLDVAQTWSELQTISKAGHGLRIVNTTDQNSNQALRLENARSGAATTNDDVHLSFYLKNDAAEQNELGRITLIPSGSVADGNENSQFLFYVATLGSLAGEMYLNSSTLRPHTNDGLALGDTTRAWADLYGATGFRLNFGNGNWEATHSSGIFTVGTGDLRVTTAGTNAASVVTVGGTQTLTNKTLTDPALSVSAPGQTTMGYGFGGAGVSFTDNDTLEMADWNKLCILNAATAKALTIPPNSSVAFPINNTGFPIDNIGAGAWTLTPGSGVTLLDEAGASGSIVISQYGGGALYKRDTNTWVYRGT